MKLRALSTVIAASIMTTGTFIGITGGTASATPSSALCIDQSGVGAYCAYGLSTSQFGVIMSPYYSTQWTYPKSPYQDDYYSVPANTGYIQEGGTDCLQLDEADYQVVRLTPCANDDADMWENWYNPTTGRTEFVSEDYYDGSYDLCLSFDESGSDVPNANIIDFIKADPCIPGGGSGGTSHWYQQWGTS
jgi:hypothetical protein